MIRIFNYRIIPRKISSLIELENFAEIKNEISWIDLPKPYSSKLKVEEEYDISFPTHQQQEESGNLIYTI